MMFLVAHSCGDCAFLETDLAAFDRHHRRAWHRKVIKIGLYPALAEERRSVRPLHDADRARVMFPVRP